jgi:hypothetical protein
MHCCSTDDWHDSEELIPIIILGAHDDWDPELVSCFAHIHHKAKFVSDIEIYFEVPQLVEVTMGFRNAHNVGSLLHFQHKSGQKDSSFQIFLVLCNVNQFKLSH